MCERASVCACVWFIAASNVQLTKIVLISIRFLFGLYVYLPFAIKLVICNIFPHWSLLLLFCRISSTSNLGFFAIVAFKVIAVINCRNLCDRSQRFILIRLIALVANTFFIFIEMLCKDKNSNISFCMKARKGNVIWLGISVGYEWIFIISNIKKNDKLWRGFVSPLMIFSQKYKLLS